MLLYVIQISFHLSAAVKAQHLDLMMAEDPPHPGMMALLEGLCLEVHMFLEEEAKATRLIMIWI